MQIYRSYLWALPFIIFFATYLSLTWYVQRATQITPTLVGLCVEDALYICSQQNIHLTILQYIDDATIQPHTIISQKPAAQSCIKEQQSIFITVSKAPEPCTIPELRTLPTQTVLKNNTKKIKYKFHPITHTTHNDVCLAHIPEAGTKTHQKRMTIYQAKQKHPLLILPDFSQQSLIEIMHLLDEYAIPYEVYDKNKKIYAPYPKQAIIKSQIPLAGTFIPQQNPPCVQLQVI